MCVWWWWGRGVMARNSRHLRQTGMVAHKNTHGCGIQVGGCVCVWWWDCHGAGQHTLAEDGHGGTHTPMCAVPRPGRQRSARCRRKRRTTASPLSWSKVRPTLSRADSSPSSPPTRNVTVVLVLWPAATTPAARPIANRCLRLATPPAGHTTPGTQLYPCSGADAALCTCECVPCVCVGRLGVARRYGFGARTPTGETTRVGDACKLEKHAPALMKERSLTGCSCGGGAAPYEGGGWGDERGDG